MTPQVHAPQPTRFIEMGEGPFEPFPALAQQALPARPVDAPTIPVDGVARLGLALPIAPTTIRFRDVAPNAEGFEVDQGLVAVIALIPDHFFEPVTLGRHGLNVLGRGEQRLAARGHIAGIGILHRHRHNRAGVEIDRRLRFMREVRAAQEDTTWDFEGLDAERAIAWRAADSFALRDFLRLELPEGPPDHSTISRTRRLIDLETHQAVFTWIVQRLAEAGLVKGQTVGIDATTLEANAALRSIVRRDTGESFSFNMSPWSLNRTQSLLLGCTGRHPSD